MSNLHLCIVTSYELLTKISDNLNIPHKPLKLRTCATRCLLLYLSTVSQPTCVFISAGVSEFRLFNLHSFHVCLLTSKRRMIRSKEFALNFASSSKTTAAETHQMLKEAFCEQALSQGRIFEWFKRFKFGRESVEDRIHSGRQSTCTTPEIQECVKVS